METALLIKGEKEKTPNTESKWGFLWPRQESNLHLKFRKLLFYPLNYEANCRMVQNNSSLSYLGLVLGIFFLQKNRNLNYNFAITQIKYSLIVLLDIISLSLQSKK
tara:strand:- start:147783 stop:148100 length:318 start_codon:yes stop_codon:yes gene_type:complete